jgi:hypothetical protein
MVDRHYFLNLKPWSARTLYVYEHAYLAQKYSVGLQEIFVARLCSQEENSFFLPWCKIMRTRAKSVKHVFVFRCFSSNSLIFGVSVAGFTLWLLCWYQARKYISSPGSKIQKDKFPVQVKYKTSCICRFQRKVVTISRL